MGFKKNLVFWALWIAGVAVFLPICWPIINADGVSYLSIAQKYGAGHFSDAINGYWGPLLSWLAAPGLALGLDGLIFIKIVILASGLFLFPALRRLAGALGLDDIGTTVLLAACLPIGLYMAFSMVTPDFVVVVILLHYLAVFFRSAGRLHPGDGIRCGILGALAYLAKPYAFYFFLIHFTAGAAVMAFANRKKSGAGPVMKSWGAGLAAFFLISGTWIGIISHKYGHVLVNSAFQYNMSFIRPDSPGEPIILSGLTVPPDATAVSSWDDPIRLDLPRWNPIGTSRDFAFYRMKIRHNAKVLQSAFTRFSALWPYILAAAFAGLAAAFLRKRWEFRWTAVIGLAATMLLYAAGYVLILVEDRYVWLDWILLLGLAMALIGALRVRFPLARLGRGALAAAAAWTFLSMPIGFFSHCRDATCSDIPGIPARRIMETGRFIRQRLGSLGPTAAYTNWNNSLFLSYFTNARFHGIVRPEWSGPETEAELLKHGIRYFLDWRPNDPKFAFFKDKYIEVMKGAFPYLRIFRMKQRFPGTVPK